MFNKEFNQLINGHTGSIHYLNSYLKSQNYKSSLIHLRVLIIEFRDEIYASLKSLFEDYGFHVYRSETDLDISVLMNSISPDLIIVNERMQYETGWLIASKLKFGPRKQPVWLYTVRDPGVNGRCMELLGVNQVIEYGGTLERLLHEIHSCLAEKFKFPNQLGFKKIIYPPLAVMVKKSA